MVKEWRDHRGRIRPYASAVWPDGSRLRRVCASRREAQELETRVRAAILEGRWGELKAELGTRKSPSNPTVEEFAEVYLRDYCRMNNRRPDFKEQALVSISRILGRVRVREIRKSHARSFVAERLGEVAPATANRGLAVLKHMMSYAVELEILESNPLRGLRGLPESPRPLKVLELAEYRRLVDAVTTEDAVGRDSGGCPVYQTDFLGPESIPGRH